MCIVYVMYEMRSKTSVPVRPFIYYVCLCRWFIVGVADEMTTKTIYLIFVLLSASDYWLYFWGCFASSETKNNNTMYVLFQSSSRSSTILVFYVNISLRVQQIYEKMAFIYYKFIAHRYSAWKTNGRLWYGVLRRERMKLNLYNKNWIGL